MDPIFIFLLFASFFSYPILPLAREPKLPNSHITVVGAVYCDVCYNNTFSTHSYFLPGVDVHVQCKFQASSPKTTEQITLSVTRTTNRFGVYKLEIPSIEDVDCVDGPAFESLCQASLIESPFSTCNVPNIKATSNEVTVKSRQSNTCIYSLSTLSYRPTQRNFTLCGDHREEFQNSLNSSKFFLPYVPPYGFFWPPLPQLPPLPPLPQLPPFPSFPFPPLPKYPPFPYFPFPPLPPLPQLPPFPSFPFPPPPASRLPFPNPPALPFPFPPIPPFPPTPSLISPPPPAFNLRDPRTWIPNFPSFSPPPPPAFNLRDPSTWIPFVPPTPPNPQNQQP